ncbi:MAG: ribonuclease P protein component [Janthinobacterium lividum]
MSASTKHRLRKHPEYQRVYKGARKQWAKQIAYFSAPREPGSQAALRSETAGPRIGLTVPKVLGKAVDRNRIKRRLREIVREALPLLGNLPVDVILHPKRSVLDADFSLLQRDVAIIFKSVHARSTQAKPSATSVQSPNPLTSPPHAAG